jgi:hypothetical protein
MDPFCALILPFFQEEQLPLHVALSHENGPRVWENIVSLFEKWPGACRRADKVRRNFCAQRFDSFADTGHDVCPQRGFMPLHYAICMEYPRIEVLERLIEQFPDACMMKTAVRLLLLSVWWW